MKLKGTAYWAKVQDGNHDEFGGREFYKITVALDDESWSKFNKSGLGLVPKAVSKDDEDILGVTFRRDVHAKTGVGKNGKGWSLGGGAPKVTLDGEEFDGLIGNGSEVEVTVDIYDAKKIKKKGHRLESIKILDLVKYESPDEDDDDDTPPFDTDEEEQEEVKTPAKAPKKKLPF